MLGGLRFILAFVLLLLAWLDKPTAFIVVMITAFTLDAIDGPIARRLQQDTEQGSRLDTVADFSVYTMLVVGVWWLWRDLLSREILYVGLAASSMLLPLLVALIKFHTFTSYHTWLVKFATVCIAVGSLILILGGPALPFRIASIVSALAGLEQIFITLLLNRPRSDVRHLAAVIRRRQNRSD